MRAACLLATLSSIALTGCPDLADDGTTGGRCVIDSDCTFDGDVCARDHACHPADAVRMVVSTWTIRGMPANDTTCLGIEDLFIRFEGSDSEQSMGYAPVPCHIGQFTEDKLPKYFFSVELGVQGPSGKFGRQVRAIDADGNAQFDLMP